MHDPEQVNSQHDSFCSTSEALLQQNQDIQMLSRRGRLTLLARAADQKPGQRVCKETDQQDQMRAHPPSHSAASQWLSPLPPQLPGWLLWADQSQVLAVCMISSPYLLRPHFQDRFDKLAFSECNLAGKTLPHTAVFQQSRPPAPDRAKDRMEKPSSKFACA